MPEITEQQIRHAIAESDSLYEAPRDAKPRKLNRSAVHSIRFTPEEEAQVRAIAQAQHLPASTMLRSWILQRLETETSAA